MSDPTYRIDVEHDPHFTDGPWYARIYSLANESFALASGHHRTTDDAQEWATAWVAAESLKKRGFSLYVDDDGRPVEGHSVKA